jgi:hypothetical protein
MELRDRDSAVVVPRMERTYKMSAERSTKGKRVVANVNVEEITGESEEMHGDSGFFKWAPKLRHRSYENRCSAS